MEDCAPLAKIPEIELTASKVEAYWIDDRVAYVKCAGKHKELKTVIVERTVK